MESPRVLIAGAGYLGMAFAELMQGADVTLARRSAVDDPRFKAFRCDFSDAKTLRDLPDFDLVYYSVAADSGTEEAYEKAYYTGLKNLVDHFEWLNKTRGANCPAFFYSSSTSVYAAREGEICTESSTLVESGPSRHMVRAEQYLLQSTLQGSVLRYGGIYGPSRTSLLKRVKGGLEPLTPGHVSYMNRIHQRDAVRAVKFLFDKGARGIFNVVDQAPSIRDEVILWVANALAVDNVPLSNENLARGHRRVVSTKLQDLGFTFEYPSYREGYPAQLAEV